MPNASPPGSRPLLLIAADAPSAVRAELVTAAARARVSVLCLDAARSCRSIDGAAGVCGAGTIAVCGPGWMQARAATVACGRDLPFACVPCGAQDVLAHDLGGCWEDPAGALAALLDGDERALDLGEVNGVTFVNYVAIGDRGGAGRARLAPVGHDTPAAVLVTNNHFAFDDEQLCGRECLDSGRLGLAVRRSRASGWEHAASSATPQGQSSAALELFADGPVLADVDGWPRVLTAPLRFRVLARALRVLRPRAP